MERQSWDIVCFGGEETLCLAKFAEHVTNNLASLTPYFVHVEGRYLEDESGASVLGKLKKSKNINGYIRNIRVEDIYEQDEAKRNKGLSVGCSNATLEDIAADRVSFFFFGEPGKRQELIYETPYLYYAVRPLARCTEKKMKELNNEKPSKYLQAIAVAKRLGNDAAKDLLIRYLQPEQSAFDTEIKVMAAEAFRSLEKLCEETPRCSRQATDALIDYIKNKFLVKGYRNSVIYAIEALGSVVNHNEDSKLKVFKYLPALLSSYTGGNLEIDWHVVWASLVTLTRTMPNTLTETMQGTLPISAINKSLLDGNVLAEIEPEEARKFITPIIEINKSLVVDSNVLAEIKPEKTREDARSAIQKVMAEVTISSGIIPLEVYLSLFRMNKDDLNSILAAGERDRVRETKKLGANSENLITKLAPRLVNLAEGFTIAMATAIVGGLVKAYFHLP